MKGGEWLRYVKFFLISNCSYYLPLNYNIRPSDFPIGHI